MRFVIVGNGVAGMEAALALRGRESEARITVVSAESEHFFSRPALMYVFARQLTLRDTEPYDRGLYGRMGFGRKTARATALDAGAHTLTFEDGFRLEYDRLLLATGSRGRPAPWKGAEGPGLHHFVTLQDLEGLDHEAKPGMRAVVIGGGLIGVEVAEILHDRGLHVTFVVREEWYFPTALDRREAELVAEHLRGHGIDVRLGARVEEVLRGPDASVRGVLLASGGGEIEADLLVSAIGVVPNTGFLEGSGVALAEGGAVETDDALRTTAADVWAAGDCANVTWHDGSRRPEQLWYTARDQGRLAARSMLGDDVRCRRGTWYNSAKFFDLEYTAVGWVPAAIDRAGRHRPAEPDEETWYQRVPGRTESRRIVVKGGRVVGFNFLGSRFDHRPLLRWIAERRPLEFVLARLGEVQFDEELSPRFRVHHGASGERA